jgi:hypothetical protein
VKQTIVYRCSRCKVCGEVPWQSSLASTRDAILADHVGKNPGCKGGEKQIELVPEGKAA